MARIPSTTKIIYNRKKYGYSGQLGRGGNAVIRFIQTAITPDELDAITLVENIQGSERWEVRDLFQRDVDGERVARDIIPYFQDEAKVKFFNPLTLIVVPVENSKVASQLHGAGSRVERIDSIDYNVESSEGYFRFATHPEEAAFSFVEWNDRVVKVVAIDGQHRLSALKRWKEMPAGSEGLRSWTIPVVILGLFQDGVPAPKLLDVVRKTFIYINSTAAEVNVARRILLDDESVNAICVQELVQTSHSNDCRELDERLESRLPLLFFDWRGEVRGGSRVQAPGSVKGLEEIYGWFVHYILGEDGGHRQLDRLELDDIVPPLNGFGFNKKLTHPDSEKVREQFRSVLLPAMQCLLERFQPYETYVKKVRELESRSLRETDYAQHAFMMLRFGTHRGGDEIRADIARKREELVGELLALQESAFDPLLRLDVGMRAVVYAFCELRHLPEEREEWLPYSEWFVEALNRLYKDGWFRKFDELSKLQRELLTHIVYDVSGGIINYRLEDQGRALGGLFALLIAQRAKRTDLLTDAWENWGDSMKDTALRGFKKSVRATLRETFKGTPNELSARVKKDALLLADKWQKKLYRELGVS